MTIKQKNNETFFNDNLNFYESDSLFLSQSQQVKNKLAVL